MRDDARAASVRSLGLLCEQTPDSECGFSVCSTRSYAQPKKSQKTIDKVAENLESSIKLNQRTNKMKTPALIVPLLLVAFAITSQNLNAQPNGYSSKLISPTLGQVLYPGQQFRIEWAPTFPNIKNLNLAEMEIWLSLDGGRTFTTWVAFTRVDNRYYDWTVPNTPTNAAVLDIRFGREAPYYPETYSPQPASTFVIAQQ